MSEHINQPGAVYDYLRLPSGFFEVIMCFFKTVISTTKESEPKGNEKTSASTQGLPMKLFDAFCSINPAIMVLLLPSILPFILHKVAQVRLCIIDIMGKLIETYPACSLELVSLLVMLMKGKVR